MSPPNPFFRKVGNNAQYSASVAGMNIYVSRDNGWEWAVADANGIVLRNGLESTRHRAYHSCLTVLRGIVERVGDHDRVAEVDQVIRDCGVSV
jgi:hypothetical protein